MKYIKIIPFIFILFSCNIPVNGNIGNNQKTIEMLNYTQIETATNSISPTNSITIQNENPIDTETSTATPKFTDTMLPTSTFANQDNIIQETNLYDQLPKGMYIAYEIDPNNNGTSNEVHLMDIDGVELGKWMDVGAGNDISVSPNSELIIMDTFVFGESNNLIIYNLLSKSQYIIPINNDDCYIKMLSESIWSPDSQQLALQYCGAGIGIIDVKSGKVVSSFGSSVGIPVDQKNNPDYKNYPGIPLWSPNGKWIAYFIFYYDKNEDGGGGALIETAHGPYVTDTSCIVNDSTCVEKSHIVKILHNRGSYLMDSILAWTPDNYLALLPADFESNIYVYDVMTSKLIDTIILPENVGSRAKSMIWSPDNQWIMISNDIGMGTFLFSRKTHEIRKIIDFPIVNSFWIEKN